MTPTSRTLKLLRKENKLAEVVERWNCFTRQRKDFLGFVDIIALDIENQKTIGIQCTSTSNMSARVNKILKECKETALAWLRAGNSIEVIGWAKRGEKNKRKTWQHKRLQITLDDFNLSIQEHV